MHYEKPRWIVFMASNYKLDIISGTPTFSDITSKTDESSWKSIRSSTIKLTTSKIISFTRVSTFSIIHWELRKRIGPQQVKNKITCQLRMQRPLDRVKIINCPITIRESADQEANSLPMAQTTMHDSN